LFEHENIRNEVFELFY